MEAVLLCLDVGTSSCKAVLFNEKGQELASASGSYKLHYPGPEGHVEQNPEEIWQGVCEAITQLPFQACNSLRPAAISISAQISSPFLVDADGTPLHPIISWMDQRARLEAQEMEAAFPSDIRQRLLGAALPAGASWPIPKLKWLTRHRPEWVERARYLIQPKEWVLWKLTGVWMSDVSSLRYLMHQEDRVPCDTLLQWAGVDSRLLPPVGDPWDIVGPVLPPVSEKLGLPAGLPVVLGWNDLNAAVLGLSQGDNTVGFDMTGTSEHLGIIRPITPQGSKVASSSVNRIPFLPGQEIVYGVTSSGGFALQWFLQHIEKTSPGTLDFADIIESAATVAAGSDGLLFLPYLQGERTPWWNPDARGVYFGLSPKHYRSHLAKSVLEGVGYALKTIYDRLGQQPETIRIAGGASRIPLWNQIKADILGVPLEVPETAETGCLGAAVLAAFGLGLYGSVQEAASQLLRLGQRYEPIKAHQEMYANQFPLFEELYHTLVPLFSKATRLSI